MIFGKLLSLFFVPRDLETPQWTGCKSWYESISTPCAVLGGASLSRNSCPSILEYFPRGSSPPSSQLEFLLFRPLKLVLQCSSLLSLCDFCSIFQETPCFTFQVLNWGFNFSYHMFNFKGFFLFLFRTSWLMTYFMVLLLSLRILIAFLKLCFLCRCCFT